MVITETQTLVMESVPHIPSITTTITIMEVMEMMEAVMTLAPI